jgi:anti-sigma factor RsiW
MMGNIIKLHRNEHREVQALLPWYVTGRLDDADRARVAAHLSSCAECREELQFERRLDVEVAGAPMDVEHAWTKMRQRAETARPTFGLMAALWRGGGPRLALILATQIASVVLLAVALAPRTPPAPYHALAAAPAPAVGNVLVMFRPDAPERALRQALEGANAQLADGPTRAGAYVLHVPAAERARALARLRASGEVILAQPVDGGAP